MIGVYALHNVLMNMNIDLISHRPMCTWTFLMLVNLSLIFSACCSCIRIQSSSPQLSRDSGEVLLGHKGWRLRFLGADSPGIECVFSDVRHASEVDFEIW